MKNYYEMAGAVTRWYLVRHAPVTAIDPNIIYGSDDPPADVSQAGKYSEFLAKHLPQNGILVTSTLQRAVQTANAVAGAGVAFAQQLAFAEFNEQSFGDWQGRTYSEIEAQDKEIYQRFWLAPAFLSPPGGESFAGVSARVGHKFLQLSQEFKGKQLVLVAHGGPIKAILAQALDMNLESAFKLSSLNYGLSMVDVIHYDNNVVFRVRAVNILPNYY